MNVANEVFELLGKWAMAQRIKQDGGLGYGQSCLASLGEARCALQVLLPRGVHDLAGAFVLVDQVMAALNPLVAETVRLLYVDRFSQVQVARRHACAERTVRRRMDEALVRLQDAWMMGEVDEPFYSSKKSA